MHVARSLLVGALALGLISGCTANATSTPPASTAPTTTPADQTAFQQLEKQFTARLGVFALDTGNGRTVSYRPDERFAYDSTIKLAAAGALLQRDSDAQLNQLITYTRADLLSYAPITAQHVATGMTLHDLIGAALQYSDNTAFNLMVTQLGGPAGLQAAIRAFGDQTTHVDRNEPTMNEAVPGDIRDTTTPRAMAADVRNLVLGTTLGDAHRTMLKNWLLGNTTGGPWIRAGVPAGWPVADKTGNGGYGTRNDIAVIWPPGRSPIVLILYSARTTQNATSSDALLADATKEVFTELNK